MGSTSMHAWLCLALACVVSYALCGIPFGKFFAKSLAHVDLQKVGSGNIGTTNALRAGGPKVAILTLFCVMSSRRSSASTVRFRSSLGRSAAPSRRSTPAVHMISSLPFSASRVSLVTCSASICASRAGSPSPPESACFLPSTCPGPCCTSASSSCSSPLPSS